VIVTPTEITTVTALAAILKEMGTWPILSLLILVVLGPWGAMFYLAWNQERRHVELVRMYENNVALVKTTQDMAEGWKDLVVLVTQSMSKVLVSVENNLFCPLMRRDPKVEREVGRQ